MHWYTHTHTYIYIYMHCSSTILPIGSHSLTHTHSLSLPNIATISGQCAMNCEQGIGAWAHMPPSVIIIIYKFVCLFCACRCCSNIWDNIGYVRTLKLRSKKHSSLGETLQNTLSLSLYFFSSLLGSVLCEWFTFWYALTWCERIERSLYAYTLYFDRRAARLDTEKCEWQKQRQHKWSHDKPSSLADNLRPNQRPSCGSIAASSPTVTTAATTT